MEGEQHLEFLQRQTADLNEMEEEVPNTQKLEA